MILYTARVWIRDDDKFDVTRGSGGPAGEPFAPSQALRDEYKAAQRKAMARHDFDALKRAWAVYSRKYLYEMERSLNRNTDAWRRLLERERVVLVCYCPSADRCHRALLADMLSNFEGVEYKGEIEVEE